MYYQYTPNICMKYYGQGLLTVSMEGREVKHIALQHLGIFRHEFIMLIQLPEHGHEPCSNTPYTSN